VTTVTPFLWFDADLAEPLAYYASVFPTLQVHERAEGPDGSVFSASVELFGQRLQLLNGGPIHAGFKESISLFISVETQEEVDDLWERLTADGGEPGQCGWLKDRYGLSWQVVPEVLGSLIGGPDPRRAQQALEAMLTMGKLDVAALQAAYDR
jgi:predicted 3-demethylubiquinone-9 3-methyltransferase (glyoxalase superfamily)